MSRPLSQDLRRQGQTWAQIAARIAAYEHVTMRVAFRLAHGLSQREVAARWCDEFPTETGTASMSDKIISYWETWPQSGYEPSLKSLKRLARIYQCNVGDLIDNGDYSHLDVATLRRKARPAIAVNPATDRGPAPPQARAVGMTSTENGAPALLKQEYRHDLDTEHTTKANYRARKTGRPRESA